MKSLLVCAAIAAFGCSDVRVVDDDGAGGAPTGVGGAPNNAPLNARLFSAGWLGTETEEGILIWNDPDEQGIARPPDVTIPMEGARLVAAVGDDIFVFTPPQLLVYENAWEMTADTQPTRALDVYGNEHPQLGHRMRVVPELDLLAIDALVFKGLATLSAETTPVVAPWFDPVYDAPRDRLFVLASDSVAVLEQASTRDSFETDWELYASDYSLNGLAADGATLYTAEFISATTSKEDWHLRGWPLDVTAPASSVVDEHAAWGTVTDLVGVPAGGLLASAHGEIGSWPAVIGDGNAYEDGLTWRSPLLSKNGRVYAAGGFDVVAFSSVALADPVLTSGGHNVALIER